MAYSFIYYYYFFLSMFNFVVEPIHSLSIFILNGPNSQKGSTMAFNFFNAGFLQVESQTIQIHRDGFRGL